MSKQLHSFADLVRNNPAIDIDYFPNTLGGVSTFFWSGSPRVSHANPWELASYSGETNTLHNTTEAGSVRLVRGGQSIDTFVDNGDGTVTQSNTGLMWAKCAKGLTGTDCGTGTAITEDWATVLTVASDTTLAGYDDWRLPNAKELQSLVDYGQTSPSINFSYFPNTPSNHFWSSSTLAQNASFALGLYFGYGANLNSGKNSLYHVRFVRGGQRFFAFGLTTATTGTGSGTVATDLTSGTNCGANCQVFNERTIVVLNATPNAGSTFVSWNGCTPLVGHPDQCYVTIDAAKTVTATFDLEKTLTVNIAGTGTVTATYTGVGTDCTSNCVLTYPNNAAVALNATPPAG
ncbi:DUF1566 domain-containing protein, partial [Chromatium okenii]|uniref:Lcl domain-containing protein n=1 Tax=Chromatium okenii TaxID=61644 RepID=UPI0026F20D8B